MYLAQIYGLNLEFEREAGVTLVINEGLFFREEG